MLDAYYGLLTSLGATDAERGEQLNLCIEALEVFPMDAQLLCALGGYLQAQGNLPLASQAYHTAYKFGQVNPFVWHVGDIRDVAAVCHSLTLQLCQQPDAAVQFLESALGDHSDSTRMRRRLIEIFIQQGDRNSALSHVGALAGFHASPGGLAQRSSRTCFAVQQNLIAAKAYLNAGYCARLSRSDLFEVAVAVPVVGGGTRFSAADSGRVETNRAAELGRGQVAGDDRPVSKSAAANANRRVDAPPTPVVAEAARETQLAGLVPDRQFAITSLSDRTDSRIGGSGEGQRGVLCDAS